MRSKNFHSPAVCVGVTDCMSCGRETQSKLQMSQSWEDLTLGDRCPLTRELLNSKNGLKPHAVDCLMVSQSCGSRRSPCPLPEDTRGVVPSQTPFTSSPHPPCSPVGVSPPPLVPRPPPVAKEQAVLKAEVSYRMCVWQQCFSPSTCQAVRASPFSQSSPSPTRKTFATRRSQSPIAIRPSNFPVKRKFEPDGSGTDQMDSLGSPAKRSHPSDGLTHPLAH
ncbi:FAM122B, partial [Cordylochernes scorpioides]